MVRKEIKKITEKAIKKFYKEKIEVKIERPSEMVFGDYATNVAMIIAKQIKKNPLEIAENLKFQIQPYGEFAQGRPANFKSGYFDKIEAVKPGFINFFLSKKYLQEQVSEILKQKEKFGGLILGKNKKINIEFISANPTGPLTLGNGRGGFCGDVLANVLAKAGYKTFREYYINDVGEQVKKLGHSVIGDSETIYKGDYIFDLRKKVKGDNPEKVGEQAAKIILEEMIKPSTKKMGIKFDVWFSEKSLYQKKEVDKVLEQLKNKNLCYKKQGALWFKSTNFGDDKDRVLIKANGEKTYFASDIAYLKNKISRGFDVLIYFWGADHYGYVARLKAAAQALGYKKEQLHIIVSQLVRLFADGKEMRMSKRTGNYTTLDELIDEVGLDIARFFFLIRNNDTHLNFDLDLAKEQSEKNPVFYIQYAHARICAILRKCGKLEIRNPKSENLKLLNHPSELNLIKQLIRFPEIIEDIANDYQVQRLPLYAIDLAASFHQFYRDCQVLTGDRPLLEARTGLILATKIVLKNTLDLMGISVPPKM